MDRQAVCDFAILDIEFAWIVEWNAMNEWMHEWDDPLQSMRSTPNATANKLSQQESARYCDTMVTNVCPLAETLVFCEHRINYILCVCVWQSSGSECSGTQALALSEGLLAPVGK